MLKNYFKTAFRNLYRNKGFAVINILGLTIGLASVIFIFLWIQNELTYDRYNVHAERTYRVSREFLNADGSTNIHLATIALPFAPLLEKSFPEADKVTRFLQDNDVISYQQKKFTESKIIWTDDKFFDVFTYSFIEGNAHTALTNPNTVVITRDVAKKYFNNKNVLNQTIYYGSKQVPLKITGIIDNVPSNSHFHFDFLISFITLQQFIPREDYLNDWGGNNYYTYLLLKENTKPQTLQSKLPAFLDKVLPAFNGNTGSKGNRLHLQKITDIHLHSHLMAEAEPTSDIKYVYIFGCIGFFILLIACINYMNLATALALSRQKEVGVRKVIGAERSQLFFQFFTESTLIIFIALLLSLGTVYLLMSLFERFTDTVYFFSAQQFMLLSGALFILLLITTLLAGSYPSFYLSRFKPIAILKGKFQKNNFNFSLRKTLVVFQFTISIVLIVAVLIVSRQLNYMQNANLGFNKNWVMTLPVNDSIRKNFETVKDILLNNTNIESTSFSSRIPSGQLLDEQDAKLEMNGSMQQVNFRLSNISTDFDYIKTFKIKIAAGRDFSKDFPTDSINAFLINEAAVRASGWKSNEDAINKNIEYGGRKGRVIGVVNDFNFESLEKPILPIVFYITPSARRVFSIRLTGNNLESTVDYVKSVWQRFAPNIDFSYSFLDERLYDLYKAERRLNTIYFLFAGIAIFIACLGLFGLATFTAGQRTKEIGIRKVLGASVADIASLLSKDFLKLVVIALLIATPISWWAMKNWLQNFAFHINISWWIFLSAGLIVILIALATVSFQAIKAAIANPVKSLRTE
jgi:putative ABC transport system permease protein